MPKEGEEQASWIPKKECYRWRGRLCSGRVSGVLEEEQRGWNRAKGGRGRTAEVQGTAIRGLDHVKHYGPL